MSVYFKKINTLIFSKIVFIFALLCVVKYFDSEFVLLPFFVSACGSSGGSSGGGGGGGGGGYGAGNSSAQSGGYGAGMSTGPNSQGNNPSGMQSGGGISGGTGGGVGGIGGGGGSTPFLCTWNGKKFQFENDILFGKPVSLFFSKEKGLAAYESGNVLGDCYKITNTCIPKDGNIAFQIKEIEPEESYIDYLSLLKVTYPKNGKLIMGSDFSTIHIFDERTLLSKNGIKNLSIKDKNGLDIHKNFITFDQNNTTKASYVMEDQDVIEIKTKVTDITKPLYLLIGSHYRDWTLGTILQSHDSKLIKKEIAEIFLQSKSVKSFISGTTRVIVLALLLGVVWLSGLVQTVVSSGISKDTNNDTHKLASIFGIQSAHADIPFIFGKNSLVVEYATGSGYQKLEVIQPRCYQKTLESIRIPGAAISSSGEVTIKITATRKHDVTDLALISSDETLAFESTVLPLTKAFHKRHDRDYVNVLTNKLSGEYLHTLPSDIVDVEFGPVIENPADADKNVAYLIQAHGFYTPVSDESQRLVGDWVSKLDPESREILGTMYPLADYQNQNRKTVL